MASGAETVELSVSGAKSSPGRRIVMEGPLSKWTNVVNGWQYRWFVLDQGAGLLSYYTVSRRLSSTVCT